MKSKLSLTDFRHKLQIHTKIGNPIIKGTPFAGYTKLGEFDKIFFGRFDDTGFRLTKNSSLFPIPYIIEGSYGSTDKNEVEIVYQVKPIWFGYLWIRVIPIIALIVLNCLAITQKHFDIEVYLGLTLLVGILFLPIPIVNFMKTKFLKSFVSVFEIRD